MNPTTVRCPLRLTLAGGGSDIPEYSRRYGGFVVSATINLSLTVSIGKCQPGVCSCKIKNRASPAYVKAANLPPNLIATTESSVPNGSGLGGSGALMVSLLKARYLEMSPQELAAAAYNIERYAIGNPTGIQDAYVAALGSCAMYIKSVGSVVTQPLTPPDGLYTRLALFATGIQREAKTVLAAQAKNFAEDTAETKAMHRIVDIGRHVFGDILKNQGRRFGELTHEHWLAKRATGPTSTSQIDEWYELARSNGASGGKVCGAGAGGFLLLVVEPKDRQHLIQTMTDAGLKYTPFHFVNHGAEIVQ